MHLLLTIYALLQPLFLQPRQELRIAQEHFFQLAVMSLTLCYFSFFKKNRLSVWVGIFGLYAVGLSTLGGGVLAFNSLLNIFFACMLYFLSLNMKKEGTALIFKVILWVCVINLLFMVLQRIGFDFVFLMNGYDNKPDAGVTDWVGFFGYKGAMGIYMTAGLISMLFINPYLAPAFLIPLFLSRSTGAVMGMAAGVSFWLWWLKRKAFYVVLPLIILGAVFYIVKIDEPMGMFNTRPGMWKLALNDTIYGPELKPLVKDDYLRGILTGFGLDSFRSGKICYFMNPENNQTFRGIKTSEKIVDLSGRDFLQDKEGGAYSPDRKKVDFWDTAHNSIVSLFYEMGLLGVFLIGMILYQTVKIFKEGAKSREVITLASILIVFFVSSMTQFPERLARLGYLIPICLGLLVTNSEG